MAKAAFITLRVLVALGALLGFGLTAVVMLIIAAFSFAKALFGAVASVVVTFATAFQKSPDAPSPDANIPLPLYGLAVFFVGMFVSVFVPDQKIYLHVIAVSAVLAEGWEIWRVTHDPAAQSIYWPVILLWAIYYAICLRR